MILDYNESSYIYNSFMTYGNDNMMTGMTLISSSTCGWLGSKVLPASSPPLAGKRPASE
jgi:hypothetical protein